MTGHRKNGAHGEPRGDMGKTHTKGRRGDMEDRWGHTGRGQSEPPRPRETLGRQQGQGVWGQSMLTALERGCRPGHVTSSPTQNLEPSLH